MAISPPRTIEGVRQALPANRREEFMDTITRAPHTMLPSLLDDWRALAIALSLPDFADAMSEEVDVESAPEAADYVDLGAA